jgi:hypothetical protein
MAMDGGVRGAATDGNGRTKFAPQGPHLLSPWVGFAVVCAYAAAVLIAAAVILRRRDA